MNRFKILLVMLYALILSSCVGFQPKLELPPNYHIPPYIYQTMVIQIQPTIGHTPDSSSVNIFKSRMSEYGICAIQSITVIVNTPVDVRDKIKWSYRDLRNFEYDYRTVFDGNYSDEHIYIFVGYVPGNYAYPKMENVAGLALDSNLIFYFDRFPAWAEAPILTHEVGHVIGLVNRDCRTESPVNPDRPNHCNIRTCVMYWQAHSNSRFDDRCQRDIDRLKLKVLGYSIGIIPQHCDVPVR